MRFSSKPAVYLIDGLNFVRSFLDCGRDGEEKRIREFVDFVEDASRREAFAGSSFRIILDGAFRPSGPLLRGSVKVTFSESRSADDVILEQASYLKASGQRAIVVSSDGSLIGRARAEGIKTLYCGKFHDFCRA